MPLKRANHLHWCLLEKHLGLLLTKRTQWWRLTGVSMVVELDLVAAVDMLLEPEAPGTPARQGEEVKLGVRRRPRPRRSLRAFQGLSKRCLR
jgi:hypothetical protein